MRSAGQVSADLPRHVSSWTPAAHEQSRGFHEKEKEEAEYERRMQILNRRVRDDIPLSRPSTRLGVVGRASLLFRRPLLERGGRKKKRRKRRTRWTCTSAQDARHLGRYGPGGQLQ